MKRGFRPRVSPQEFLPAQASTTFPLHDVQPERPDAAADSQLIGGGHHLAGRA